MEQKHKTKQVLQSNRSDEEYMEMLEAFIEKSEIDFLLQTRRKGYKVNQAQIESPDRIQAICRTQYGDVELGRSVPFRTVFVCETLKRSNWSRIYPTKKLSRIFQSLFRRRRKLKYVISNLIMQLKIVKSRSPWSK
jgi:hypothetical protein